MLEEFQKKYKGYKVDTGIIDEPMWEIFVGFTKVKLVWDCINKELRPSRKTSDTCRQFEAPVDEVLNTCDSIMKQVESGKLKKHGEFVILRLDQIHQFASNTVLIIDNSSNIISKKV